MNLLIDWAIDHGIDREALADLFKRMGAFSEPPDVDATGSEAALQNKIRVAESKLGCRMFRNNRGVAFDKTGRPVRFGLGNDSPEANKVSKSSDLIGIEPVEITQEMVGHTIGRFVSLEIKKPGWKYSGNSKEIAQMNWIAFINALGGRAAFVSSMVDYE